MAVTGDTATFVIATGPRATRTEPNVDAIEPDLVTFMRPRQAVGWTDDNQVESSCNTRSAAYAAADSINRLSPRTPRERGLPVDHDGDCAVRAVSSVFRVASRSTPWTISSRPWTRKFVHRFLDRAD